MNTGHHPYGGHGGGGGKKVEFHPPNGFALPEGTSAGDHVKVMANVHVQPSGKLCLSELDGCKMPGYEDKDESQTDAAKPSPMSYAERYRQAMGGAVSAETDTYK